MTTEQAARFIDKPCEAKIIEFKAFNCSILIPVESAMLVFDNPTGNIILTPLTSPLDDGLASIFSFTSNDLFDNKITRSHNFNTDVVDVTLSDPNGRIVNVKTLVTRNTVTLDLKRIQVTGTWKFLVERL